MAKDTSSNDRAPDRKVSSLERALMQAAGEGQRFGREDDPARTTYPNLWAWLSTVYVGRDSLKQPAYLTIRLGPEGALATLTDRDLCVALDVGSGTLQDVFSRVEDALAGPNPPLRTWGKKEPALRRRKAGS